MVYASLISRIGSSPLVRGSGLHKALQRKQHRFIPARAGIGAVIRHGQRVGTVHPRSCGDRMNSAPTRLGSIGSSPLVRGSAAVPIACHLVRRFIPARAGIGSLAETSVKASPVHPRSCGDRNASERIIENRSGSSPLVRGSDQLQVAGGKVARFIPARAGIGFSIRMLVVLTPVHPRSCGDRGLAVAKGKPQAGSSPLVRGSAPA